jgi:hypothetical protein
MKTLFVLFVCLCAFSGRAQGLEWRLQISLSSTNSAAAASVTGIVASSIRAQDLGDSRNRGSAVDPRQSTDGRTQVAATFILKDEATATNAFARIATNKVANVSGAVTLHCCPIDGTVNDWGGCRYDTRAKFREVLW